MWIILLLVEDDLGHQMNEEDEVLEDIEQVHLQTLQVLLRQLLVLEVLLCLRMRMGIIEVLPHLIQSLLTDEEDEEVIQIMVRLIETLQEEGELENLVEHDEQQVRMDTHEVTVYLELLVLHEDEVVLVLLVLHHEQQLEVLEVLVQHRLLLDHL